ncbi:MAG: cbb3-type cytochrome oxidase assembly protein CcoS [Flavobacteriaceae bacterium]|jgi:cbb3-type cytochrome oxidase maturation protein|nr:cbb3-type cytochrome oxidase assembly protein CcoS [Flavobacteriaceae bacterium]
MEVIYLTMTITVIIAGLFLYLFFVNVKKGQYDDIYTPSVRMLFDDELVKEPAQEVKKEEQKAAEVKKDS